MDFAEGDKLLYFNTAYGMVKETLKYVALVKKLELIEVILQFPATIEEIVAKVKDTIEKTKDKERIKLAVFSHITSTPAG